ncbi:hypothetical protein EVAR_82805_1 [Eumeta japonica]|uniref:Uncharacterized protein n=1 Tax=Eumeta variegata TaxID=151549 RepID=A0A4C1UP80_EUMVA|nr:hypothetical protein EVAR_82805_1 [Eumeta japonica]
MSAKCLSYADDLSNSCTVGKTAAGDDHSNSVSVAGTWTDAESIDLRSCDPQRTMDSLNSSSWGGPITGLEPRRSLRYGRESVFRAQMALMRCHGWLTVADTHSGRTCGSDAPDNLSSRECDRFREYLRQLVMPSRSRPMPTGTNAGHPARVSTTEHARRAPDRPAYKPRTDLRTNIAPKPISPHL